LEQLFDELDRKPTHLSFDNEVSSRRRKIMRKLVVTLSAAALIIGSAGLVKATPLVMGVPSPNQSPIERVGCTRSGDNCPIGFAIKRQAFRAGTDGVSGELFTK
jgi:hypothetical protein